MYISPLGYPFPSPLIFYLLSLIVLLRDGGKGNVNLLEEVGKSREGE